MITPTNPRSWATKVTCSVLVVAVTLVASGCSVADRKKDRQAGALRIVVDSGSVRLTQNGRSTTVRSTKSAAPGDLLRAGRGTRAHLLIGPGSRLDFAEAELRIVSNSKFRLMSGNVLVQSNRRLEIDAQGVKVESSRGIFRVDKGLATRAGNYSAGRLMVIVGPDRLSVAPYNEAVVAGGVLPKVQEPLRFSADDAWDRRILAPAIDLDSRLTNFARGLEAQLVQSNALDFFGRVAQPGLATDSLIALFGNRRSDLLIGLILASEASALQTLPLDQRFSQILAFWTDGATWGLIAQQFEVDPERLFTRLAEAVAKADLQVIGPGPGLLKPRPRPTSSRLGRGRGLGPTPSAQASPQPGTAGRPGPPALLSPPIVDLVPEGLQGIIDEIYGVVDPSQSLPRIT
ncbi:MAG: hypothetical protein ACR2FO_03690 [Actinomycetota bacterium]